MAEVRGMYLPQKQHVYTRLVFTICTVNNPSCDTKAINSVQNQEVKKSPGLVKLC